MQRMPTLTDKQTEWERWDRIPRPIIRRDSPFQQCAVWRDRIEASRTAVICTL